jgi:hypothetical protein
MMALAGRRAEQRDDHQASDRPSFPRFQGTCDTNEISHVGVDNSLEPWVIANQQVEWIKLASDQVILASRDREGSVALDELVP